MTAGRRSGGIREDAPALVVLDVMLPETDGLAVARAVRDAADPVPILMLSARGSVPDRIRGLEWGADDYLPKPFSPAELVARVKVLLRRTAPAVASPSPARAGHRTRRRPLVHGDLALDLDRHEVRQDGRLVPLTSVELRLLAALLRRGRPGPVAGPAAGRGLRRGGGRRGAGPDRGRPHRPAAGQAGRSRGVATLRGHGARRRVSRGAPAGRAVTVA